MADEPRSPGHTEPPLTPIRDPVPSTGAPERETPDPAVEPVASTAVEEPIESEAGEKEPKLLHQEVTILDAGPCKKHVKVSIPRTDIDARFNEKFSELVTDAQVPGYRPGKAPRKLIEKKFYKDVSEQLKAEILLQSLEQMAEKHHLNPLTQPDIDPYKIELPKDGPLEYEFDIEVAPEFELPEYKGLTLKRPIRDIKDADVEKAERQLLSRYGKLEAKDAPAQLGDYLVADVATRFNNQELSKHTDLVIKVDPQLAFKDGIIKDFGDKMKGVQPGETRKAELQLSPNVTSAGLRGQKVEIVFDVKEVKSLHLPELTHEFLHQLGVHNPEQLRELVRGVLKRQLEYQQRQSAREQVLSHIAAAATWELPQDLLVRQARKTLARRVMELRQGGFPEEEIRAKANLLQQDSLAATERSLKEHFVLQKIAEVEKLDVTEDDIDFEIEQMAEQSGESPRRVRARLEKEELLDTLATQIIERKSIDLVLSSATYEDVPFEPEGPAMGAVEEQAVPGSEETPEEAGETK